MSENRSEKLISRVSDEIFFHIIDMTAPWDSLIRANTSPQGTTEATERKQSV